MIGDIIMHSILSLSVIAGLGLFAFLTIVIRDAIIEKKQSKSDD